MQRTVHIVLTVMLLTVPLSLPGLEPATAQETSEAAPFYYRVTNGNTTQVLEALVDGRTAVEFYDYSSGDSSSHTGYEQSETLSIFLWSGPDGKSLVFMADEANDGSGGELSVQIDGLPDGANWAVKDDPGDGYTASSATWRWISCCTDGGVMDLATNDAVSLELTFPTVKGLDTFRLFGGPAEEPSFVTFDPAQPVVIETFQTPGPPGLSGEPGPGAGTITLNTTSPSDDGGDPVTEYRFYEQDDAGGLTFVGSSEIGELTLEGLGNGATHTYIARAVNLGGEGDDSAPATVTTHDVPDAPEELTATSSSTQPGTIKLTWQPPAEDGGLDVDGYDVLRDGSLVANVAAADDPPSYTDTGLADGTTYTYTVYAQNAAGQGPPATAQGTTFAVPGEPQDLQVESGPSPGSVLVNWSAPAEDGGTPVVGYTVYAGSQPDALEPVAEVTGTSYEDPGEGLPEPEARYYAVTARNIVGQGPATDTGCGVPMPYGALQPLLCG